MAILEAYNRQTHKTRGHKSVCPKTMNTKLININVNERHKANDPSIFDF